MAPKRPHSEVSVAWTVTDPKYVCSACSQVFSSRVTRKSHANNRWNRAKQCHKARCMESSWAPLGPRPGGCTRTEDPRSADRDWDDLQPADLPDSDALSGRSSPGSAGEFPFIGHLMSFDGHLIMMSFDCHKFDVSGIHCQWSFDVIHWVHA
jgi:hypothetical protein